MLYYNLKPIDQNTDWQQQLKTMPLSKLKQITKNLNADNTE